MNSTRFSCGSSGCTMTMRRAVGRTICAWSIEFGLKFVAGMPASGANGGDVKLDEKRNQIDPGESDGVALPDAVDAFSCVPSPVQTTQSAPPC